MSNGTSHKKSEIDSNTIIVEGFNTSLTSMDRSSRPKLNKEKQRLKDIWDQMDFTDIYETTRKQQKTISSKMHMHTEYFPGEATCLATKKASIKLG